MIIYESITGTAAVKVLGPVGRQDIPDGPGEGPEPPAELFHPAIDSTRSKGTIRWPDG